MFAGKVGTGFTQKTCRCYIGNFRVSAVTIARFVDLPSKSAGQWSQNITPSMMKKMHWVNPKFRCEIKFAEWTRDKKFRAPVFPRFTRG